MENIFQRVGSISNAHVGREFEEAAVIAEVFNKTTRTTPAGVLATCQRRLRMYDANI